ncbi:MAG: hypothetical protein Q4B77_06530 [Coriobacteriaceae bacterium]|nr:hypothetical protein [Coriobacteriaceae bacterium]
MRSASDMPSAFWRLLGFELRRFATPFRITLTIVSLIAMVVLARDNLLREMAIASSQLAASGTSVSPTALDMVYLAFNNQLISGLILPAVCGMLCADLVVRDRVDGMRTVIHCEMRSGLAYVVAKLAVVAIVCQVIVFLLIVACTLISCLFLGLPLSAEPSAWLASNGPQDSIWAQYGPIPHGWNYALLIVALGVGFGVLETVLSWTAMAVCSLLKSPSAAPLAVASFYVVAAQVESLVTSLGLLLGIKPLTTTIGWIIDRLCLVNYRLGATLFQESAGGAYQGPVAVTSDIATSVYPINSWASLLLIVAILSVASIALLLFQERRCCK